MAQNRGWAHFRGLRKRSVLGSVRGQARGRKSRLHLRVEAELPKEF